MTAPRVLLVSRRFWPLADPWAALATHTATAFCAGGLSTTVITAHGAAHWPASYDHNGVQVTRLLHNRRGWFAQRGERRALGRWFHTVRDHYDVVLVLGLQDEAATIVEWGRRERLPVVLRAMEIGPNGECHQQMHTSAGMRRRRTCAQAAALVAGSELAQRELIAAGYPRDRLCWIPPGITLPAPRDSTSQLAARADLAQANLDLQLPADAWVAVHALRPGHEAATLWLLWVWHEVLVHHPRSRLWLMGDSEMQRWARRELEERHLLGAVQVVGTFDECSDFYLAADALIEPGLLYEPSQELLNAMAAALPVIVACGPSSGESHLLPVHDGRTGRRIPEQNIDALVTALGQLQSRPDWALTLGQQGRQVIAREFSPTAEVESYRQLFARLGR